MPRGNSRGRGRGNFKQINSARTERESVLDRINKGFTDKNAKKYKFVRSSTTNTSPSCVATIPVEARIRFLAKKFLKTYYEIFDQSGRANLESQYNADAFFSFSSTFPIPTVGTETTVGRNLLEVRDPGLRINMLFHDKTNIAKALASFWPTEHMINNLSIDVPFYIANPMSITSLQLVVTGIFKDTSQTTNPLRAFTRVFVIKHTSIDQQGEPVYEIFNDLFVLQAPTPDQIKVYHQESLKLKRLQAYQQDKPNSSMTSGGLKTKSKEDIIKSIMEKTKMNRVGSTQLLQESDWDEEKSLNVFNALLAANRIPQHFFTP